jgi:hypothetical protein
MRLRCRIVADDGPEVIVCFRSTEGFEELVIGRDAVRDGFDVGYPIAQAGDAVLVELPRETTRGACRAWVPAVELLTTA